MQARSHVVFGDAAEETRAIQTLALALAESAAWAAQNLVSQVDFNLPRLLQAAAESVTLATLVGSDTPIAVLALSARNTFELHARLRHLLSSSEGAQAWREEAVTDQLQFYEGILGLEGPNVPKRVIEQEMARVKEHAASQGLKLGRKLSRLQDLVKGTDLEGEYRAFYKAYSKFVHPSSFVVNWPLAASTPTHRATFVYNLQLHGHLIIDEVRIRFGLPTKLILKHAEARMPRGSEGGAG